MTLEGRRLGSGVKAPTKNVGVNSAARPGGQAGTVPQMHPGRIKRAATKRGPLRWPLICGSNLLSDGLSQC